MGSKNIFKLIKLPTILCIHSAQFAPIYEINVIIIANIYPF